MTWGSFVEYVNMRALDQEDTVYRNYDLSYKPGRNGSDWHTFAISAAEAMKLQTKRVPLQFILADVQARLRGMGYVKDTKSIEVLMCEWYIWHRIRTGALHRWRVRKQPDLIL